jgi:hypothetical protein
LDEVFADGYSGEDTSVEFLRHRTSKSTRACMLVYLRKSEVEHLLQPVRLVDYSVFIVARYYQKIFQVTKSVENIKKSKKNDDNKN